MMANRAFLLAIDSGWRHTNLSDQVLQSQELARVGGCRTQWAVEAVFLHFSLPLALKHFASALRVRERIFVKEGFKLQIALTFLSLRFTKSNSCT